MRLTLTDLRELRFTEPFGEGPDRQDVVRAASAIVRFGGGWLVAQDDSNFAAVLAGERIDPLRLYPRDTADVFSESLGNKRLKPDLEAGLRLELDGAPHAVLFGSGSLPARQRAVLVRDDPGRQVRLADLSRLYDVLRDRLGLAADALNLEGACSSGDAVHLFQRGNAGESGVNARIRLDRRTFVACLLEGAAPGPGDLEVDRCELGLLDDAPLGFSGAEALPDGSILFSASAEASPNTYDDGPCAGSAIGLLSARGSTTAWVRVPAPPAALPPKLEGIAVERSDGDVLHLLAVTDADDPATPSLLLRLRFER